jgi:hypothetical protein
VASDFALVFEANHKTNHYHRRNSWNKTECLFLKKMGIKI